MNTPTSSASGTGPGFNLLNVSLVRRLTCWRAFPYSFQGLVLAVFIGLAVIGWGHLTPAGVNAKLYAKTNFVNLVIWGLWWPAIIWVTVLLGRLWCTVCPLELVSNVSQRIAQRLGFRQVRLPNWLVAGGLVIVLFALLQLLVPGVQLHRVPAYTSIFLWVMLAGAVVTGLFIKDRAFCRGFCPVALLLNAYGRGGMLAVRGASSEPCASCTDNGCTAERSRDKADGRSCPSLLNPPRLDSNRDCLLCGQCFKACPSNNLQLLLRPPFAAADVREPVASWPLTLFVMLVSGFVTYELCGVWKAADPVFQWVPNQLKASLNAGAWGGWIQGLWTVIVVPLLLWLLLGAVSLLAGGAKSLGEAWRRLALPMAVVAAAGHMAKGLEKFTSWAGFLPYALHEPTGVRTAVQMNAKAMAQPAAWLSLPALSAMSMALLGVAVVLAIREARLADPGPHRRRLVPILLLGGFYFFLVFGWGGWVK